MGASDPGSGPSALVRAAIRDPASTYPPTPAARKGNLSASENVPSTIRNTVAVRIFGDVGAARTAVLSTALMDSNASKGSPIGVARRLVQKSATGVENSRIKPGLPSAFPRVSVNHDSGRDVET